MDISPACQSVVLYYGCLDGGGAHKGGASRRIRTLNQVPRTHLLYPLSYRRIGAAVRDRTPGLRTTKPVLYQLSYSSKEKTAMHSQRNRIENAGGNAFAGDWCHYAGALVHGGESHSEHLSTNPSGQRQKDKDCGYEVGEHGLVLHRLPNDDEDNHRHQHSEIGNRCYGLHGLLLCGFALGRLAFDKLGPNTGPVIGTKVLTRDGAACVQLKSRSKFRRTRTQAVHHVPEMPPGGATVNGELFTLIHRLGVEELFQVHAEITPHGVAACQHQQV